MKRVEHEFEDAPILVAHGRDNEPSRSTSLSRGSPLPLELPMRIMQLSPLPLPSSMLRHPSGRYTSSFNDTCDDFATLVFSSGPDDTGDLEAAVCQGRDRSIDWGVDSL